MKKLQARILSLLLAGVLAASSWGDVLPAHAAQGDGPSILEQAMPGTVSGNDEVTVQTAESAETEDGGGGLDYILGRPMTEEEKQEQREIADYYMSLGGFIEPEELPVDNTLPVGLAEVRGVLPAKYDARDYDWVPAVRNQNPYGTCWSFSSIACLEINLIKNGLADQGVDLSELHLAFYSNFSAPDPLGNDGGARSWYDLKKAGGTSYLMKGGNQVIASYALMNWKGAVNERLVTNDMAVAGLDTVGSDMAYGHDLYHMGSWHQIPTTSPAEMKAAILEYGALGINYYFGEEYYNEETGAEYCPDKDKGVNHAVTIVGWDDSYGRNNFKSEPENDGAWLVRNSWDSWWGLGGYFWMSYEDKSLSRASYVFEGMKSDIYDNNYQYDHTTGTFAVNFTRVANVFTAKANGNKMEELKAVGISLFSAGVDYSLQIYRNLADSSDPTSGEPMFSKPQTGMTGYAGYSLIPLNETISLEPGDTFSVVFDLSKDSGEDTDVECEGPSTGYRYSESKANAGESFGSYGSNWYDCGALWDANFRIKAYTSNVETEPVECQGITISCPSHVIDKDTSVQCEVSFNPANTTNKDLRWSSSDPSVAEVDSHGMVTGLKTGTARITATTVKGGHTADWEITVVQPVTSVNFSYDTDEYYAGNIYAPKVEIGPEDATDKGLTWTSSNSNVATVDGKGNITVKAEGSARITATAKSGASHYVDIQAKKVVECQGITISCPSHVIDKNTSVQCEVGFNPVNTTYKELRWSSSNPSVATVDENGRVTGLKTGTARITATTVRGGRTAEWEVTVVQPVTSVSFRYDADGYYVGDTYAAKVEIKPGDATDKSLTWTSSDSRVATVDGKGNITVKAEGSVRITATAKSGVSYFVDIQTKEDLVRSFAKRMYTVALSRDADAKGLADWTARLKGQEVDGAGIAYGFICSVEFKERNLNNSDYVDTLYHTFFDRGPDPEGKADWMQLLAQGRSREYVLSGFVNSKEFSNLCDRYQIARGTMQEDGSFLYRPGVRDFVLRLYTKALNRAGETLGVEDWTNLINTGRMTAEEVAKSFFMSEEFGNRQLDNADYVETLYQTFMDRGADAAGRADWIRRLEEGMTREQVLEGFSRSEEFGKIMAEYGL